MAEDTVMSWVVEKSNWSRKLGVSDKGTVILLKQGNHVYNTYGIVKALLMLSGIQIWSVNRRDTFQLSILSFWYLNCKDNGKRQLQSTIINKKPTVK